MKLETKKELISLLLTFVATFLTTLTVGFEHVTVENFNLSLVGSSLVTALRAGLKALFLKFVSNG